MSTAIHYEQQSSNFVRRYLEKIAESKLPRRMKRLIYVSSIAGLINQMTDPDATLVRKLNDILALAKHPEAYLLPIYIKSLIWKTLPANNIQLLNRTVGIADLCSCDLSYTDRNVIGIFFANNAPSWLRYGSTELMVRDVSDLLGHLKELRVA